MKRRRVGGARHSTTAGARVNNFFSRLAAAPLLAAALAFGASAGAQSQDPAPFKTDAAAQAALLLSEGQRLLAEGTGDARRAAAERFERALPLWREAGDRRREAVTLSYIGKVYDQLGDKQRSLDYYLLTLPLIREAGDRAGEAATLNNIGLAYYSLGEWQKALRFYDEALPLLRAAGDQRVEGVTLVNVALALDSLGEKQKALDAYGRALPLLREAGDRASEAVALNNVGFLYDQLGEKQKALDHYGRALPLLREAGDRRVEAATLNNVGFIYGSLGDGARALEYYERALPLLREAGDRRVEAVALNNVGLVHKAAGDARRALEFFDAALALRRATGDRHGEAVTLNDTGALHASAGRTADALALFAEALRLARAVEDKGLEASALLGAAKAERDLGRLEEATARAEAALDIVENLRTRILSPNLRASYFATVQEHFETYVALLMRKHGLDPSRGHDARALQAAERARARVLLESLNEASADARLGAGPRRGVDAALVARERGLRASLAAEAERRTRLLGGEHTAEQAAASKRKVEETLDALGEVEALIKAGSPQYAALTRPSTLTAAEIQTRVLDADTLLLEYSLGAERSYLWAVTRDSLASFELPGRATVERAARRVFDLLTARNRHVRFETPEERALRVARADREYAQASAELSRMILAPAAASLGRKRLLVVADGALQYVPFAALPDPNGLGPRATDEGRAVPTRADGFVPLVAAHEIVNEPSASTLDALRRELAGRRPAAKTLAVLADPVFEKDDARVKGVKPAAGRAAESNAAAASQASQAVGAIRRLPFTRREAAEIAALVPASERLVALGFDASRATATDPRLAEFRYVHFATHGLLDTEHPELSGLALSLVDERGAEQDGFLRAYEIYGLRLPAELVTLSGCRTGLGKEVRGEGLVGLTRGFMYAGSARVLVSLWDVADEASAELMAEFYRGVLGPRRLSPAAALRAAQLSVMKDRRRHSPYYWAAFALQGENR